MKNDALLELDDDAFEEAMDAQMEATSRVYGIRVGDVIDQQTFDAIQLFDKMARDDDAGRLTVFHQGYQAGLQRGGGADTAKLIAERDSARTRASIANALKTSSEQWAFINGARACREMMARFVEQGGDAATAASIRANWNPAWGEGRPVEGDDLPEMPAISASANA